MLRDRVNRDLTVIDKDIENAFKLHGQVDDDQNVVKIVKEKLAQLSEKKRGLIAQREGLLTQIDEHSDLKDSRQSIEENAHSLRKGWPKASPSLRKRLLRRLVDRLVYMPGNLHAYYNRTAKVQIPISAKSALETSENHSEVSPSNIYWLQKKKSRPSGQLLDACASVVSNGGGGGNRTRVQSRSTPLVYTFRAYFFLLGRRLRTNYSRAKPTKVSDHAGMPATQSYSMNITITLRCMDKPEVIVLLN